MQTKLVSAAFLCAALALPALCAPAGSDSSATGDWWWRQYHERTPGVLLFGGYTGTEYLTDTWIWNGHNWIEKFPETSPTARGGAAMAYDKDRHEVVLFGGASGSGEFGDTWIWNGRNWIQKFPKTSPSPRDSFAMAYDGEHHEIVLFGGEGSGPGALFGDTWIWDGHDWEQKFPAHSPSPRLSSTMAYDAAARQVVLFSGNGHTHYNYSDTWVWDGSDWLVQSPSNSPGIFFFSFSAAYDAASARLVLLGASPVNNNLTEVTWLWDGVDWILQSLPLSPPIGSNLAYDAFHRKVVSFDGNSKTYTWDGFAWTAESPSVIPPARFDFSLSSSVASEECNFWR